MDEVRSYVRLDLPSRDGKADPKMVPPRSRIPYWKGPGADSEEKREPASDVDTVPVDNLKALDPNRPIREADINDRAKQKDRLAAVSLCNQGNRGCWLTSVISDRSNGLLERLLCRLIGAIERTTSFRQCSHQ
jgi:hypothetical protein